MTPEKEKSRPGTRATGNRNASGSPCAGERVDLGPARVGQAEQPGTLVERLAGGVVERRAESLEGAALAHREEKRVPAAREEADEGRLDGVGSPRYSDATCPCR